MAVLKSITIPTLQGGVLVDISNENPIFIVGGNGVGKSALVALFVNQSGGGTIYIPGSRPSYFDNESLSMTPASRRSFTSNLDIWNQNPQMRWSPISGTARNEKAILDLQMAEIQYKVSKADQISAEGPASLAVADLVAANSPLDRANILLRMGNLPMTLVNYNAEIYAVRDGSRYSIARMSDGERSALILVAEVMSALSAAIFVIDEPELHLHRAIVVPLIAALIRERPDCGFVVSTHELGLPAEIEPAQAVLVRGCSWTHDSVASWDIDILSVSSEIPEELRTDILGSRRKVLFIEGTGTSLDQPLYALLFPKISIRPRMGCREIRRAVDGLKAVTGLHGIEPYGLVDNDGMSANEIRELEEGNVFPLPIFSVESIYYGREIRSAIADQQATALGEPVAALLNAANASVIDAVSRDQTRAYLASRLAERALRASVFSALPTRNNLLNGDDNISISVRNGYRDEVAALDVLIATQDADSIIRRYPVRDSGALTGIAEALRFRNRQDYEKAVLVRLAIDTTLVTSLRSMFGGLSTALS